MNRGNFHTPIISSISRKLRPYTTTAALLLLLPVLPVWYPVIKYKVRKAETTLKQNVRSVETVRGTVEYTEYGTGYPLLLVHGAGGGYDQGLFLAENFTGIGLRVIIPSRFGYLGTPLQENSSAQAQADIYAELLNTLGIRQAAVMGVSDGGPSTLQFALRYPERTSSVIMMAAKSHTPPKETVLQKCVFTCVFSFDILFWYLITFARPFMTTMFGVTPDVQKHMRHSDVGIVRDFIRSMLPVSLRKDGIRNDRKTLSGPELTYYPLKDINAPVLVIHATDDLLQPVSHGIYTAQKIPGARFIRYETGGHLLIGHFEEIKARITAFIMNAVGTGIR